MSDKPKEITRTCRVERVHWGPGDTYLAVDVGRVQVMGDGWRIGDIAEVIIRKREEK